MYDKSLAALLQQDTREAAVDRLGACKIKSINALCVLHNNRGTNSLNTLHIFTLYLLYFYEME